MNIGEDNLQAIFISRGGLLGIAHTLEDVANYAEVLATVAPESYAVSRRLREEIQTLEGVGLRLYELEQQVEKE